MPLDRGSSVSVKKKRVVVLDDDRDVAEVIQTILLDEGFAVSCLYGPDYEGVATAVRDLAPDCVILDGAGSHETDPWVVARSLAMLKPAIPTVMLSGSETNREEAILGESDRAKESAIAAVVPKPFDIDRLVLAVSNAMGAAAPSDVSRKSATADTERLLERLRAAGAHDLRTSTLGREWVTFRATPDGDLFKVYRWQTAGAFFIGRYAANGARLEPLSQISDTEAAAAYCERLIEYEREGR